MSLQALYDSMLPSRSNLTAPANSTYSGNIPGQLFESIIPGYGPIHKFILYTFGIDITLLVTLFAIIWTISKLGHYTFMAIYSLVAENYMSSIHISSYDDIYGHLMKWLADQPRIKASRSLMAETQHKSAWEVDEEETEERSDDSSGLDYLNFSNQEAKAPPRYVPAFGTHKFWHKGTYFKLQRVQKQYMESSSAATFVEREDLTISCFGRSPQPIKNLLQDAKDFYLRDHNAKTVIRRPAPKDMRRWGGRNCWTQIAHRPCRPMETVVLDAERKADVLRDINEYLHPATPRWYANRGIPYRRGYLFHGPPGTGKTSLSFALAGVFGLDIYVISLLEPTLTEEDLGQLFTSLPRRCVVLLEDIDTAGLIRTDTEAESSTASTKPLQEKASDSISVANLARALKKANEASEEEKKKGISLSGLLNAIDGVASHEGRVLVMTTNKPEKLDDALIRPGRVDLQVAFGNATQPQIKELFERMYTSDKFIKDLSKVRPTTTTTTTTTTQNSLQPQKPHSDPKPATSPFSLFSPQPPTPPTTPTISKTVALTASNTFSPRISAAYDLPERTLDEIATDFASKIPEDRFSPAEVQGFLLKRKKNPQKALKEIERWVESMLELKVGGKKVLNVQ